MRPSAGARGRLMKNGATNAISIATSGKVPRAIRAEAAIIKRIWLIEEYVGTKTKCEIHRVNKSHEERRA